MTATPGTPKFARPKILVVDVPEAAEHLTSIGYFAAKGTYGTPLVVQRGAGYLALEPTVDLPNYTEQEIIVIDLAGPKERDANEADFNNPPIGVKALWAPTNLGVVDPRLASIGITRRSFERVYERGGVFVVFAAANVRTEFLLAARDHRGLDRDDSQTISASNWDVIDVLSALQVGDDDGCEIELADNGAAEQLGLGSFLRDASFSCVVKPPAWLSDRWLTLAISKYGEPVSGIVRPDTEGGGGWVVVLPRVTKRVEIVRELIEHVLPVLAPGLFPHVKSVLWTRRREYELPQITAIKDEIAAVQEAVQGQVRALEERIEYERHENAYLHELLTATGDDLVAAVIAALKALGFEDVRDVDAEREAGDATGSKREDVHIMDATVPVLVEVKGIGGLPKEASSLQVAKYLAPRMREWNRTDLMGLCVVNHQRALPALDREHEHVFQPDVLTNALKHSFGLLTTWDLHRLARSFRTLGWRHEDVARLFTTSGRVRPVPSHYEHVGHVDGFWEEPGALGVRIERSGLAVGDWVAYELPIEFVEEPVESLRLNDKPVESVPASAHVGLRTGLTKQEARKRVRVYRVIARSEESAHGD